MTPEEKEVVSANIKSIIESGFSNQTIIFNVVEYIDELIKEKLCPTE